MLSPLKIPVATAVYTLLGVLLAKYWFDGIHWPMWLALIIAGAAALGVAPIARSQITSKPVVAMRAFETYSWINGLLAAIAACATVLVTVELSAIAGKDDPLKELITQATAALTTLIGGVVVATKDADETLGKRIAKEFESKFTVEGQPENGKVALKPDSAALLAVFSKYANGWTDWSRDNRTARVESLRDNLASDKA